MARRTPRPLAIVVSLVLAAIAMARPASAGIAPESVAVVVNADSWASLTVANEYARLRHIPSANIVTLKGLSSFDSMNAEAFRTEVLGPVLKALDERGLRAQIDCVTYSVDLPNVVMVQGDMQGKSFPQVITPAASANGVTYLHELFMKRDPAYLDLDVNRYARRTLPLPDGRTLGAAERAEYQRGVGLYDQKKFAEAVATIAPILAEPCNDASVYYNFACCQALAGDAEGAMASLTRAADIGWRNHGQMTGDPDLASLVGRADFKALVERMKSARIEVQPAVGFSSANAWSNAGGPAADGPRYLLSTMLGVTSGRGNSVAEVLACLARSEQADGTAPKGTVYIMRNGDIRSKTREWAFGPLVDALRKLGIAARVDDGVLPQGRPDVAGAVVGIADFRWGESRSTVLPGAICEHLTSCGGMMGERDGQTPCTDFIRAGAAGTSGAVTEPYALQAKFPSPFIQWHYARGATLAEAFYLSLEGPYQLLVIGDPLCRPWSKDEGVRADGLSRGMTLKGSVEFKPHAGSGAHPAQDFELFVDGMRTAHCRAGEALSLDTAALADGAHAIALVARRADELESRDRSEFAVKIANSARATPTVKAPSKSTWGKPLSVELSCAGASSIDLVHAGRVLATVDGDKGTARIEPVQTGAGSVELHAVARFVGADRPVLSAPARVEIEMPVLKGTRAPKASTPGLSVAVGKSARAVVQETFDAAWLAPHLQDGKPFEITAYFDAAADDLWQIQLSTNTDAVVEVDGAKVLRAAEAGWHYAPARLADGTHKLRITGRAPSRAADARMDLRIGCAGTQHPTGARFRCEMK